MAPNLETSVTTNYLKISCVTPVNSILLYRDLLFKLGIKINMTDLDKVFKQTFSTIFTK